MKERNKVKSLSKLLNISGFLVAIVAIYRTVKVRASLPPGACPVENQRGLLFLAIGLLMTSVLVDWILEKKS